MKYIIPFSTTIIKNHLLVLNFIVLILAFSTNRTLGQNCLDGVTKDLMLTIDSLEYDIQLLDIGNEEQFKFSNMNSKYELVENNYIDKSKGYTFFQEGNIEGYYIGFYLDYNLLWDTYKAKVIARLPNSELNCSKENSRILKSAAQIKLDRLIKSGIDLESAKCKTIEYVNRLLKGDCKGITNDKVARAILGGVDIEEYVKNEKPKEKSQKFIKSNPICNCYKLFVEKVNGKNLNYDNPNISKMLVEIYKELSTESKEFKKCTDNTIFDGDLFSKSKLRIYSTLDPNCVDSEEFSKIIEKGPYIYKSY